MDVDDDDRRLHAQLIDQDVRAAKRIVNRRHKGAPHDVEDPDGHAVRDERAVALTREAGRIVGRTQHAVARLQVRLEVALIENMISAGNEVDAGFEQLLGGLRRQTKTARDVFAVGDAGVNLMLIANQRDTALERVAAG